MRTRLTVVVLVGVISALVLAASLYVLWQTLPH